MVLQAVPIEVTLSIPVQVPKIRDFPGIPDQVAVGVRVVDAWTAVEGGAGEPVGGILQVRMGQRFDEGQAGPGSIRRCGPGCQVIVGQGADHFAVRGLEREGLSAIGEGGVVGEYARDPVACGGTVTGGECHEIVYDQEVLKGCQAVYHPIVERKINPICEADLLQADGFIACVQQFNKLEGFPVETQALLCSTGIQRVIVNFGEQEVCGRGRR